MAALRPYWIPDRLQNQTGPVSYIDSSIAISPMVPPILSEQENARWLPDDHIGFKIGSKMILDLLGISYNDTSIISNLCTKFHEHLSITS